MRQNLQSALIIILGLFIINGCTYTGQKESAVHSSNDSSIKSGSNPSHGKGSNSKRADIIPDSDIDLNQPPWETGCDSLMTQLEMNICSAEKLEIADSILDKVYDELIKKVESNYLEELAVLNSGKDDSQKQYVENLRQQKNALVESRKNFDNMVDNTASVISLEYEGGSMRPLAVNSVVLELTVNQIKFLSVLSNEWIR